MKRFKLEGETIEDQIIHDSVTNESYFMDYLDEFVDLINSICEENEELKDDIGEIVNSMERDYERLEGKYENLKQDNTYLRDRVSNYYWKTIKQEKEIERLKRKIKNILKGI